jgi:hypothetical protein
MVGYIGLIYDRIDSGLKPLSRAFVEIYRSPGV